MSGFTGLELRSTVTESGGLTLSLEEVALPAPGPGEAIVRVEAAPINPSDLGLLIGPADMATLTGGGTAERPVTTLQVPQRALPALRLRFGQSLAGGNEGAGTVVAAGEGAEHLIGRTVAALGGGMYAQYRLLPAAQLLPMPEGVTAEQASAAFVNPLTVLGFIETMRHEGHSALVNTAAASNLGQMLVKLCLADNIPLVSIVRSPAQVELLKGFGATHVLDSSDAGFDAALVDALDETGATIAFDAIGGGTLGSRILGAMEAVAQRHATVYNRYGSDVLKQLYVYGLLDPAPTQIHRSFGLAWNVGGWLVFPKLQKMGVDMRRLYERIAQDITTIFASHYTARISLAEALQPETIVACDAKRTAEKYLIQPHKGG